MSEYDFARLNDKEFEVFAIDLLSAHFGKRIERFKPGKDKGVDGRYFSESGEEIIIQCKHYAKTGYKELISTLKSKEKEKVLKLSPKQYIFATSLPLSRENKKEIVNIFHPYIISEADVYGREDLNSLLAQYHEIEERHFKLWISSTTVLREFINRAIFGRSKYEVERIERKSIKYVQTENHDKALALLKKNNVLIILGEPGIGKTTLAENLCLYFISKGYEFFDIEESLSEAESVFTKDKKQIFYFDDFLGSNYFEAIENKKDSHIIKFIDRIHADNSKLFILTSRTNIMNHGMLYSSIFANSKIRKNEFLLTIAGLAKIDMAKILYNHIWHSDLSEAFIDEIYKEKRYKKIIEHHNFNPRLIEFITDTECISGKTPDDYWGYIEATLNNPKDIWDLCFRRQNNQFVRALVELTVFNGGVISEDALRLGFSKIKNLRKMSSRTNVDNDFNSSTSLATRSFLNRNQSSVGFYYSLFNPSIGDYILGEYRDSIDELITIFQSLESAKSLDLIVSFEKEKTMSPGHLLKLKSVILDDALAQAKGYDYLIVMAYLLKEDVSSRDKIISILNKIVSCPLAIKELAKFLNLIIIFKNDIVIRSYEFLFEVIGDTPLLKESEIENLASFIKKYSVNDKSIISRLSKYFNNYIDSELNSEIATLDPSDYHEAIYIMGEIEDVDMNKEKLQDKIRELGYSLADKFSSLIMDGISINIDNIIAGIDIEEVISDFYNRDYEPDWVEEYHSEGKVTIINDPVDDLFERV